MKVILTTDEAITFARPAIINELGVSNIEVEIGESKGFPSFNMHAPCPVAIVKMILLKDQNGYVNKIACIKELRTVYGWSLVDSKNYIEQFF